MEFEKHVIKIGEEYVCGSDIEGKYKLTKDKNKAQGYNPTYGETTHILKYEFVKEVPK